MTRVRHRGGLCAWIVVSLVLHSFLLALPGRFIETVFPTKHEAVHDMPTDLTPDFEEIAISVVRMPGEPAPLPAEIMIADDTEPSVAMEPSQPSAPEAGPPLPAGYGNSDSHSDTRFFPPVPRLIVPPELHDLEVSVLNIDIRILVGIDGRPVEIELPETLADPEIRKRLLESAARFRFEPARKGDLPVASWISLPLELETSPTR